MSLAPKTRLGPYEIVSAIGAGGMGEVYRARDQRLSRDVAIKVLSPSFAGDPDRLRRFEQEARAAGALNHPNILAVYDLGTHNGSPYLVSEFLEGETLREKLSEGPLPSRKAIEITAGIAQGLAAAHEKGIFHRDLKPENIFLTRDGRAKILDFGLAKITVREPEGDQQTRTQAAPRAAATEPGIVLGTVGYMSPEQVRGQAADARADIFALGAILYEMLSGQRAFRRESSVETMSAILKEDPPELSTVARNIPPALERIVNHCLEKNPDQRFQSARDLAFDLEALSGLSGASATHRAAAVAASASALRRRLIFAAVGTAGLVLACAITWFFARRAPAPLQPEFQRITYRPGTVDVARFGPDGQSIFFTAAWQGAPFEIDSSRAGNPESHSLGLPPSSTLASISPSGEMAVLLGAHPLVFQFGGTLAEVSSLGGTPRQILADVADADWSPENSQLAVVHFSTGSQRLEFPIGKVLYQTQGWIGNIRFSPKGDRIAFADHPVLTDDAGSVAVVGLDGKVKTLTSQFDSLGGLAWSPSGDEVWFTASPTGNIAALYAVSLTGNQRLLDRIPGNLRLRDVSRDGRVLAVQENARIEMNGGPVSGGSERDLSWLDWSLAADLSADRSQVLFTEGGEGGGPDYSVYLRPIDGSSAVKLGGGQAMGLSPDGKWVLAFHPHTANQGLFLLPTGAGQPHEISHTQKNLWAGWFPDGKHIWFLGVEPNHHPRIYLQSIDGGAPRPISPEGVATRRQPFSPDDRTFFAQDLASNNWLLYSVEGGAPRPIAGLEPGDQPLRWSSDGRSLFISHVGLPTDIYRLDPSTGHRALLKRLMPGDPSGVSGLNSPDISADGKVYVYSYGRTLDDLYLIRGLH
jgi:Tol biopolymer transport system component